MKEADACTIKMFLIPIMVQGLSVIPMPAKAANCCAAGEKPAKKLTQCEQHHLSLGRKSLSILTTMKHFRPIFGRLGVY
ncbi:hypothetical protein [Serratia marcescens]|uniref:hypothetical protein n=1 Tax=Serratia marcescens TaxID=615 RepID=UPI001114FAE2|nr:hypothetical protein [Serratia marcescens]